MDFKSKIRTIPNYPIPGVQFRDITTLLQDGAAFQAAIEALADYARKKEIDYIIGPEARGFVIGAPLAYALGVGFIPVRKKGKLPAETVEVSYQLEYGEAALAIHRDAFRAGQKLLIVDDLLATGGTVQATCDLIQQLQGEVVGAAFLIELTELKGRERLPELDLFSVIQY
jgi:adenine phosphoribosyltransferase